MSPTLAGEVFPTEPPGKPKMETLRQLHRVPLKCPLQLEAKEDGPLQAGGRLTPTSEFQQQQLQGGARRVLLRGLG